MSERTVFDKLTPTQLAVFEQIAVGNDAGHNRRTLNSLVQKGLVSRYQETRWDTYAKFVIDRYQVPVSTHMAWCRWCAGQEIEE